MAKYTQTIRRQIADELFVFGHFVNLVLKGLTHSSTYHYQFAKLNIMYIFNVVVFSRVFLSSVQGPVDLFCLWKC